MIKIIFLNLLFSAAFTTATAASAPTLNLLVPANMATITTNTVSKLQLSGTCSEVGKEIVIAGALSATTKCYSNKTFGVTLNMSAATVGNWNTYQISLQQSNAAGTTKIWRTFIAPPAPAVPKETFSLISPAAAANLKSMATTPEGANVIRYARGALNTTPAPSAHFQAGGLLPSDPAYYDLVKAKTQWNLMLYLAQAYRMTEATDANHAKFLAKLEEFFTAWLDVYKLDFNPNSYTQTDSAFILSEDPKSIHYLFHPIVQTDLDVLIMAYDYAKRDLSTSVQGKMNNFLKNLMNGYLLEIDLLNRYETVGLYQPPNRTMNWQAHRLKILMLAAYGVGDTTAIAKVRSLTTEFININILGKTGFNDNRVVTPLLTTYFNRQVKLGVAVEGSMIDFYVRGAIHYSVYTIEPLLMMALATKNHQDNVSIFASSNSSLVQALRWIVPYAEGVKTNSEFIYSMVQFDADRAKAGMKGYSGPWNPQESLGIYLMATKIYAEFVPLATKLTAKKAPPLSTVGYPNWGEKSLNLILHGM